jgi:serine protease Do
MRGQRPQRGYLGVGLQPLEESLASALGLPKDRGELVRSVQPGEPAARAGIQQGDVIVRVNNQDVTPDQTASYLISNVPVGSRVPIDIIRDGRPTRVTAVVGQRPTEEQLARLSGTGPETPGGTTPETPAIPAQQALGLSLQPLTPALATAANLPPGARGVIITAVDPASDAAEEGLQRGDLILSVNRQAVTLPAQVLAAVQTARRAGRTSVLLLVKRGTAPEAFVGLDIAAR